MRTHHFYIQSHLGNAVNESTRLTALWLAEDPVTEVLTTADLVLLNDAVHELVPVIKGKEDIVPSQAVEVALGMLTEEFKEKEPVLFFVSCLRSLLAFCQMEEASALAKNNDLAQVQQG